jgi:hypothetical protein
MGALRFDTDLQGIADLNRRADGVSSPEPSIAAHGLC